jgi:hypothetical protein
MIISPYEKDSGNKTYPSNIPARFPKALEADLIGHGPSVSYATGLLKCSQFRFVQKLMAQTVSFWYYSFCPENCTEEDCRCVQLPYLKSQPQARGSAA